VSSLARRPRGSPRRLHLPGCAALALFGSALFTREGTWIRARIALFTTPVTQPRRADFIDFEWFRIE
jgi:hypothetical protein